MAGANANLQNAKKQTPLHYASKKNNADLCRILLENNSDPNIVDIEGNNGNSNNFVIYI